MSTKIATKTSVAKTAKTGAKAKTGPLSTKVTAVVRLTEADKAADLDNYVLNPNTKKYVKRDTPNGKKLVKAEETGEEVAKTITDSQRLILIVQTLKDSLDLDDAAIKDALKSVEDELPRSFPIIWGGKQKEARDPNHPKHPRNAYIFYMTAIRASTAKANPALSNTEIVSLIGQQWQDTSKEDRAEYEEQAAEDKERYEEEMAVYESENPDKARAKTSPEKPTKKTAYHVFCDENREMAKAENPEAEGKEVTRLLAEMWEEVKEDKEQLEKYQKLADKANEGFSERVAEYHSSSSPKKLSKAEQKKADDPENFALNVETGRYVKIEKPKSPKTPKSPAKTKKPAGKKAVEKVKKLEVSEIEVNDDDMLVME